MSTGLFWRKNGTVISLSGVELPLLESIYYCTIRYLLRIEEQTMGQKPEINLPKIKFRDVELFYFISSLVTKLYESQFQN